MNNKCHIHRISVMMPPPPSKVKYTEEGVTTMHSPMKESAFYV